MSDSSSDSFEFTFHSPLTKEDWDKISDVEHENTMFVTFQTPQGRQVRYIKCDVLDKIRAEIERLKTSDEYTGESILAVEFKDDVLNIIDYYREEQTE